MKVYIKKKKSEAQWPEQAKSDALRNNAKQAKKTKEGKTKCRIGKVVTHCVTSKKKRVKTKESNKVYAQVASRKM